MTVAMIQTLQRAAKHAKAKSDIFQNRYIELVVDEVGIHVRGRDMAAKGGAFGVPVHTCFSLVVWGMIKDAPGSLIVEIDRIAEKLTK